MKNLSGHNFIKNQSTFSEILEGIYKVYIVYIVYIVYKVYIVLNKPQLSLFLFCILMHALL